MSSTEFDLFIHPSRVEGEPFWICQIPLSSCEGTGVDSRELAGDARDPFVDLDARAWRGIVPFPGEGRGSQATWTVIDGRLHRVSAEDERAPFDGGIGQGRRAPVPSRFHGRFLLYPRRHFFTHPEFAQMTFRDGVLVAERAVSHGEMVRARAQAVRDAAVDGAPEVVFRAAMDHLLGDDLPRDPARGVALLCRAANGRDPRAMGTLSELLRDVHLRRTDARALAVRMGFGAVESAVRAAANERLLQGTSSEGPGALDRWALSLAWEAARLGDRPSAGQMAVRFAVGDGVRRDVFRALCCFCAAKGQGIPQDFEVRPLFIAWLSTVDRASVLDAGDLPAAWVTEVGRWARMGIVAPRHTAAAELCFSHAAERGDPEAAVELRAVEAR
jgi:hypothetical protein